MPIYEYSCEECRRQFSLLRPMSEADSPADCEQCGGKKTRRILSLFSARSENRAVAGTSGPSCAGCTSGSCDTCGQAG